MGKIIGLHGKKGSGKDTIANHLKTYYARDFRSVAFADPIRAALKAIFGWDDSYFERPLKDQIIEEWQKAPRDFMQPLGTEWGRELIDENLWVKLAQKSAEPLLGSGFNVIVTDVRFENEAEWIRKSGGVVWHIDRGAVKADRHKSESGIKFVKGDVRINNNETLGYLYDTVEALAKKIIAEEAELEAQRQAYDASMRGFFNEDGSPLPEATDA